MLIQVILAYFLQAFNALVEVNRGFILVIGAFISYKAFGWTGVIVAIAQAVVVNGIWMLITYRQLRKLS